MSTERERFENQYLSHFVNDSVFTREEVDTLRRYGIVGNHVAQALLALYYVKIDDEESRIRRVKEDLPYTTAELMELKRRANAIAGGEHEHNE